MAQEWTMDQYVAFFEDNPDHYEDIVGSIAEILVSESYGGYQGDISYLLKETTESGERLGYLIVGYGSCSYCDAYEACSTPKDYLDLRNSYIPEIVWFDSLTDCYKFFTDHNWEGDYLAHLPVDTGGYSHFVNRVLNYLNDVYGVQPPEMVIISSELMTEVYEFINATNGPLAKKIWEQVRTLPPPTPEKVPGIEINVDINAKNINISGNQFFNGNLTED